MSNIWKHSCLTANSATMLLNLQEYGKVGQTILPGLVNSLTDTLMGGLSYALISEVDFKKQYNTSSCAVVYSTDDSPDLHLGKFGDAIDTHNTVFRFGQVKQHVFRGALCICMLIGATLSPRAMTWIGASPRSSTATRA